MEELENEQDKIIYWIIFFAVILVVAVLGYYFVYNYKKDDNDEKPDIVLEEEISLNEYIGIWAMSDADEVREQELCINVINGSTVTFDYFLKNEMYFDSQTADLIDNTATFTAVDRYGEIEITGKIIFRSDKVFLILSSSSDDNITLGTFEFRDIVEESLISG